MADKTKETVQIEETVSEKKKSPAKQKKPNWHRVAPPNQLDLDKGDNTNIMNINLALFNMPDIDMRDPRQVSQRLSDYFALYANYDLKPTVAGMAISLNGMSRQTLTAIAHDRVTGSTGYKSALPDEVTTLIKKAYKLMENMWETYMNSGKIKPVSGIFLGKNNYGYQDKT